MVGLNSSKHRRMDTVLKQFKKVKDKRRKEKKTGKIKENRKE